MKPSNKRLGLYFFFFLLIVLIPQVLFPTIKLILSLSALFIVFFASTVNVLTDMILDDINNDILNKIENK